MSNNNPALTQQTIFDSLY